MRDSPALNVAGQIQLQGAAVSVYDPMAMANSCALFPTLDYTETALKACEGADVVLVLTEWAEFRNLHPSEIDSVVRKRSIVDGRNCLDPEEWRGAGWVYRALGRQWGTGLGDATSALAVPRPGTLDSLAARRPQRFGEYALLMASQVGPGS